MNDTAIKREPSIIFSDVDETVVNIRHKLASLFYTKLLTSQNAHMFNQSLLRIYESGNLTEFNQVIDTANNYYIEKEVLTPEGVQYFNSIHKRVSLYLYDTAQDEGFYDDLELSFIGQSLVANMKDDTKLIFLTHHSATASQGSKGSLIARYFPTAEIAFIPVDVKKSAIINELKLAGVKCDLFMDDRPDVLIETAANVKFTKATTLGLIDHHYVDHFKDTDGSSIKDQLRIVSNALPNLRLSIYSPTRPDYGLDNVTFN